MRMSLAEIIDRYTILLIKRENGLNVGKELKKFRKFGFSGELIEDLYNTNKAMWDVELEAEKTKNLRRLGELFKEQRALNKVRIILKNQIAMEAGESIELKKYK